MSRYNDIIITLKKDLLPLYYDLVIMKFTRYHFLSRNYDFISRKYDFLHSSRNYDFLHAPRNYN